MANMVTISTRVLDDILNRLDALKRDVEALKKGKEPVYGSEEWWELSDKQASEEIKKSEYYELHDSSDIDNFFDHIDDEGYLFNTFHHKGKKTS